MFHIWNDSFVRYGVCFEASISDQCSIVVDLDVTRPSFPSLAAIDASTDTRLRQRPGEISAQYKEKIEHLKDMMSGHQNSRLLAWLLNLLDMVNPSLLG